MRRGGVRARVARQITGCTPTTSYIDELLDERTAVMETEMVMVCSRKRPANPNVCPFTPELGVRRRVTGKGGEIDSFHLASVKPECDGECRPRPGMATTRLRYRRALNVSRWRPGPARGRLVTTHRGRLRLPETLARALF
jgi:hypothetical protein